MSITAKNSNQLSNLMPCAYTDKNVDPAEENVQATNQLPLDCKASWFACVCLSLANFICVGSCYVYGIFFPTILKEFQAGKALTALPGSFASGFLTILCPIASVFVKRFGGRIAIPCGCFVIALGLLGSSFAPNIYVLCLTYGFVLAWGSCFIFMAGFLTVPLYFDKHRSLATSMVSAGPGAGFLLMSPISQSLLEHFGWRKAMTILAGINLVACMLGLGISRKLERIRTVPGPSRQKTVCSVILSSMKFSVLKDPALIVVLAINAIVTLAHGMPIVHLIRYAEEIGIPSHDSSWMYPIKGSLSTICRVLTGRVGDTGRVSFYHMFQFGAILMGLANFLMPLSRKLGYLYAYAMIQGMCEAMYFTSTCCLAMVVNPECGVGWLMFFAAFPIFISPVIAGLIADLSHSYVPVFYKAGSVAALAALVTFSRHCVQRQRQKIPVASSIVIVDDKRTEDIELLPNR